MFRIFILYLLAAALCIFAAQDLNQLNINTQNIKSNEILATNNTRIQKPNKNISAKQIFSKKDFDDVDVYEHEVLLKEEIKKCDIVFQDRKVYYYSVFANINKTTILEDQYNLENYAKIRSGINNCKSSRDTVFNCISGVQNEYNAYTDKRQSFVKEFTRKMTNTIKIYRDFYDSIDNIFLYYTDSDFSPYRDYKDRYEQ
ncbi:hypothetical protein BB561_003402, partial [Smittium simulii]